MQKFVIAGEQQLLQANNSIELIQLSDNGVSDTDFICITKIHLIV